MLDETDIYLECIKLAVDLAKERSSVDTDARSVVAMAEAFSNFVFGGRGARGDTPP